MPGAYADVLRPPHFLGGAICNLRLSVSLTNGRVIVGAEQQSLLHRNPYYRGRIWIDDDWSRPWRLDSRERERSSFRATIHHRPL